MTSPRSSLRALAFRARREGGFTLVELLMAMFVTAVGLMAVAGTLDRSRDLVSVSERKEAVTHVGEREMEKILSRPDSSIMLKTIPPHNPDPNDPDFYVTNGPPAKYQWDRADTSTAERFAETASPSTCSTTSPPSCLDTKESWSDGRLSGKIHRYVTCYDDPRTVAASTPAGCPAPALPGLGPDYKRVTVAVTVTGGGPRRPTLFSSLVTP